MSYGDKHYDELFAEIDAKAREVKPSRAVEIGGDDRRLISGALSAAVDELRRAQRDTKIFRDRQRIGRVIEDADRALAKLDKAGRAP